MPARIQQNNAQIQTSVTQTLPPALEEEIKNLVPLSKMEYELKRIDVAGKFNIRVTALDEEVERRRPHSEDSGRSGTALSLHVPDPWTEKVDGAELLDDTVAEIKRYIILPDEATADAIALWGLHTHVFEVFHITPRLTITSPEKRCGKTRVLEVLNELVPKPLLSANVTAAAMFRTIEVARPTLLIDEADTFMKDKDEIRGVVNSGFMRNGRVIRTVGDDHEPRAFSTWCPTAFAAIGKLADTIEDRSIIVAIRRRKNAETIKRFRAGKADSLRVLARKAARWARDNAALLQATEPVAPPELNDRAADCWHPLLAIADIAGGKWPERARQAALKLNGKEIQEDQSVKVQLLSDIRETFNARGVDKLPSGEICTGLEMLKDRPWGDFSYGKPISQQQLAKLLAPFGIKPKDVRVKNPVSVDAAEQVVKGYELAQFTDTFSRYL